ncbi:TonB-dependent receptor [Altericroceibacterium spongiae]|nr:TonB-dependent receptor [Altericroceibacterium spongiae]
MRCTIRTGRSLLAGGALLAIAMVTGTGAYAQETGNAMQSGEGQAAAADDGGFPEIIVSANRRDESILKAPTSVLALDQQQLDVRAVKSAADLAAFSPGLVLTPSPTGGSNISIRGISSTAGAATTGVYIDNTPIQSRAIGYSPGNLYPTIFDLERVEVLRGPQGTLFGAGSEGGTVRFIQTQPGLSEYSAYGRAEVSTTKNGGTAYEIGGAVGGPLVEDRIGFRASAFFRRDAGWIDYYTGTANVEDPTGAAGVDSVSFDRDERTDKDSNWAETLALRGALKIRLGDNLTLSPSLNYQRVYRHESVQTFWATMSDYGSGDFQAPRFEPTVDDAHVPIDGPVHQPSREKFWLPSLNAEWEIGGLTLISDTAYFNRKSSSYYNSYILYDLTYAGFPVPQPGNFSYANYINRQENWTQELRLQPTDSDGPFNWIAGLFYQHADQVAEQPVRSNFMGQLPRLYGAVQDGAPFGPGSSAYLNWYGQDPIDGVLTWYGHFRTLDKQYAAFAQLDYNITDRLKLTVGARLSRVENRFDSDYSGPQNNLNAPLGRPCTQEGGCTPGEGAYAINYLSAENETAQTAFSPKFLLSYDLDERNMIYASATKGFRPGGGQAGLPPACNAGLVMLGYTDENGNGAAPTSYDSDSVWSYEAGAKGAIGGNLLRYAVSGYYLKWKNIQSSVFVNACYQSFVTNLDDATAKGFDLDLTLHPMRPLTLGLTVAYNHTRFDSEIAPAGAVVYSKGSAIPDSGAPWQVTLSGDYTIPLADDEFYLHADYLYSSAMRQTGDTDPQTVSYDATLNPIGKTEQVNVRAGLRFSSIDLSLFARNLTNQAPSLARTHAGALVWTDRTWEPRSIGVTAALRY